MSDPELFTKGLEHFNRGEFFEAHEVWEELWHTAQGAYHPFIQGLIQTAVAMHHAGNENWRGTRKLMAGALNYLKKGVSASHTIDVDALQDAILDFEIALQKKLQGEKIELPFFQMPLKK